MMNASGGMVEHADEPGEPKVELGPLYPATQAASTPATSDPNTPAMGQRIRLKASFVIPANWTIQEKAVLLALEEVWRHRGRDNGNFFSFSVCPDDRFPSGSFDHLATVAISNFEVVQSTGATQGPRSPGAPSANAGPDQFVLLATSVFIPGLVSAPLGNPRSLWRKYAGPGTPAIAVPSGGHDRELASWSLHSHAERRRYMHAVAHDAAVIQVRLPFTVQPSGSDVLVQFH